MFALETVGGVMKGFFQKIREKRDFVDDFDGAREEQPKSSTAKARRCMLLAVLFQLSWPRRLTCQEIMTHLPLYGKGGRPRAVHRDIETLTGCQINTLPEPGEERLTQWCEEQRRNTRLAISYTKRDGSFGLEKPAFTIDIDENEARAFIALQEGFTPGAPYADAVQALLTRWSWLFSERSQRLVTRKRARRGRPVLLPLSPVEDYSRHGQTILRLDRALEEGSYLAFAYTPLGQSWESQPIHHTHVEPYELEYRDGHWYFTAYLPEQGTFVDYRVDRIHPNSVRPAEAHDHFLPGNRRRRGVKIRYWVSPMLARYGSLSARLKEQQVTLLENEQGAIVEGYAKSLWWARRLLLGYGAQVKALEPEELVRTMREEVGMMGRLYNTQEL